MSDVTVAPSGGGAPPAASNEVPIQQDQVSRPNPLGPQTPDAPRDNIRPEGARREAIQRAFERANNPGKEPAKPARPAPKPAEAKPGHNQPPEETPKFDLRKRPPPSDQPRGERGQFAPRQAAGEPGAQASASAQPGASGARPGTPGHAQNAQNAQSPYHQPPSRMAEHAKRDWGATPESVRGEVHRMQAEFGKAYNFYKADYEAFKPIKHYHAMAQEHGTTLEKALNNYVSMEQKLRQDPIGGLDVIVNNLGLTTPDGQRLGLRDLAYTILSQTPDQLRMMQQGNTQQAAAQQIGALHQSISRLENKVDQMHNQQEHTFVRSVVDSYAASHPRLDELGDVIEQEIKLGFDLDTAYRRAELLRPTTQAPQTRTQSAQTRTTTDRSIHGSSDVSPSNGASRRPREASRSPRDAVQNAIRRVNGL